MTYHHDPSQTESNHEPLTRAAGLGSVRRKAEDVFKEQVSGIENSNCLAGAALPCIPEFIPIISDGVNRLLCGGIPRGSLLLINCEEETGLNEWVSEIIADLVISETKVCSIVEWSRGSCFLDGVFRSWMSRCAKEILHLPTSHRRKRKRLYKEFRAKAIPLLSAVEWNEFHNEVREPDWYAPSPVLLVNSSFCSIPGIKDPGHRSQILLDLARYAFRTGTAVVVALPSKLTTGLEGVVDHIGVVIRVVRRRDKGDLAWDLVIEKSKLGTSGTVAVGMWVPRWNQNPAAAA